MIDQTQVLNKEEGKLEDEIPSKDPKKNKKYCLYTKFEPIALNTKIFCQMLIGGGIILLILIEMYNIVFSAHKINYKFVEYLTQMPIFEMLSKGLAAATGIELGYMLFTDGPDEAIQPVLMAIASFIIYRLSLNPEIGWSEGLGLGILLVFIPILLETDKRYNKNKAENKD
jgi:hypothetical protein